MHVCFNYIIHTLNITDYQRAETESKLFKKNNKIDTNVISLGLQ